LGGLLLTASLWTDGTDRVLFGEGGVGGRGGEADLFGIGEHSGGVGDLSGGGGDRGGGSGGVSAAAAGVGGDGLAAVPLNPASSSHVAL